MLHVLRLEDICWSSYCTDRERLLMQWPSTTLNLNLTKKKKNRVENDDVNEKLGFFSKQAVLSEKFSSEFYLNFTRITHTLCIQWILSIEICLKISSKWFLGTCEVPVSAFKALKLVNLWNFDEKKIIQFTDCEFQRHCLPISTRN